MRKGVWCDKGRGEGQASVPSFGFGGQCRGCEVTQAVFRGNKRVHWGDGKIIPPVGLKNLPWEGEGVVVFP